MATAYKGVNATIAQDVNGANKIPAGESKGRVRVHRDSYTFLANASVVGDTIDVGPKLPVGARIVDTIVHIPASLGTTGIWDFGWAASSDAVEAADADGFVVAADGGGQAAKSLCGAGRPGLNKQFAAEVQPQLICTEVNQAALGKTIEATILYVLD